MLGKLIRFELRKTLRGKFFPLVLCLLLAVNMLLQCGLQEWYDWQNSPYNPAPGEISFWESAENARRSTDYLREWYTQLGDLTPAECAAFENTMKEKYGEDVFEDLSPAAETDDLTAIIHYQSILQWNEDCWEALDEVVSSAKSFGRKALEAQDNYEIRRNKQIIRLYSAERGRITGPIVGWDDLLFHTNTMMLVFLMVLLSSAGTFSDERDKQTWLLLHTSKNGKGMTLAAKYLSGAILASGLTILFQLTSLCGALFREGLLGAAQPAAAIEQLRLFPYPFTVWQYALLQLGCQIFAAALLSVLLNTVSALCKSSILSYGLGAVLLGACLLPIYAPPRQAWLSGPLALSDPLRFFDSFCTADLFGFPVLWVIVLAALWILLGGICILLAHRVHHRKGRAV